MMKKISFCNLCMTFTNSSKKSLKSTVQHYGWNWMRIYCKNQWINFSTQWKESCRTGSSCWGQARQSGRGRNGTSGSCRQGSRKEGRSCSCNQRCSFQSKGRGQRGCGESRDWSSKAEAEKKKSQDEKKAADAAVKAVEENAKRLSRRLQRKQTKLKLTRKKLHKRSKQLRRQRARLQAAGCRGYKGCQGTSRRGEEGCSS